MFISKKRLLIENAALKAENKNLLQKIQKYEQTKSEARALQQKLDEQFNNMLSYNGRAQERTF